MFKTDKTVSADILKQDILVNGSLDKISTTNIQTDETETNPVKAINETPLRLLNAVSMVSLALVFLVNSLSFTQNWPQLLIIAIIVSPIVIQSLVSIGLFVSYFFRHKSWAISFLMYWYNGPGEQRRLQPTDCRHLG